MAGKYNIGILFPCPCCDERTRSRTSEAISPTLRSLKFQCSNMDCGHTFEAHLSYVRTLSPSAIGPVKQTVPFLKLRPRPGPLSPSGAIGPQLAPAAAVDPPPASPPP